MDIDVSELTTALNALPIWTDGTVMPIVVVNTYWQGSDATRANKNYRYGGKDIRYNYATNRTSFFTSYANGSYVYSNDGKPVIDIGVRLINAETLPTKGLTFYCPYPLYIKGNFNTNSPKPALIITDSITLLHEHWQDWRSQMDPIISHLWYGPTEGDSVCTYRSHPYIKGTTIYADIITGRTHPHFYIQSTDITNGINQTKNPNPDFGIHDAFRSLCDFNERIDFHGSLMLPYFCQEQWEPPIDFCKTTGVDPINYAYPNLIMNKRADVGIPAAMPFYYRINRGRKTHTIGKEMQDSICGQVYNKDWSKQNFNFSTYHTALPNFLQYETAPQNE